MVINQVLYGRQGSSNSAVVCDSSGFYVLGYIEINPDQCSFVFNIDIPDGLLGQIIFSL